jgi:hypothetical protein
MLVERLVSGALPSCTSADILLTHIRTSCF